MNQRKATTKKEQNKMTSTKEKSVSVEGRKGNIVISAKIRMMKTGREGGEIVITARRDKGTMRIRTGREERDIVALRGIGTMRIKTGREEGDIVIAALKGKRTMRIKTGRVVIVDQAARMKTKRVTVKRRKEGTMKSRESTLQTRVKDQKEFQMIVIRWSLVSMYIRMCLGPSS